MIEVELNDIMGSDLTTVNAARVSFKKHSLSLSEQDKKLISYLGDHGHYSPFGHSFASFRISAPIFVARQLVKHEYLRMNEVSRRYVTTDLEFYHPEKWRKAAPSVKQGSSHGPVDEPLYPYEGTDTYQAYEKFIDYAIDFYNDLIDNGTCPEQARMVLPVSLMTEWWWSGSLDAFANM